MNKIKIALVGVGKIARDQHVPAIAGNAAFELVAAASPHHKLDGVKNFPDVQALIAGVPDLDALAICTPPQIRYDIARFALAQGRHVMLEKPPGATLNEVSALVELAKSKGVALQATWHSREAAGVEPARRWLAGRNVRKVVVTWKEDVRVWHPGQTWIWKAGGLGVFDPGINAMSIITRILPGNLVLRDAQLAFPSNCEAPVAATLQLANESGTDVCMDLDFLQTGPQTWDIVVDTDDGRLVLSKGGSVLRINDDPPIEAPDREYPNLYARFAELVRSHQIDVDVTPFQLVADAFMCGRRVVVAPFVE
ncbi:MAG TPA: Gfo/Idh/MocA family oxidoreductase [Povalibacter sp.]|uniref:Gfo/Idh/MocA family protein n=1 Tax=Povalibacter sp. TaxID=1962978 RepID=UPI002BB0E63F|nr:Gfo/Idh/MocA family oxidoreductase [Povalibacter sp.]HMN45984.1 Gfo/Idh/MocA family oxidoreductase [Povalibacter sp.]